MSKGIIVQRFKQNVKGKKFNPNGYNQLHDGKEGHWLEKQMGIEPNSDNNADIYGYEMKKQTPSKTTFGDWSAKESIFKRGGVDGHTLSRGKFLEYLGKPNATKGNRISWSGEPIPKINKFSSYGQILKVNSNDDIVIEYYFSKDQRGNKHSILPKELQIEGLVLTRWPKSDMKLKVERKFNQKGWFKCTKKLDGTYSKIGFAPAFNFSQWIDRVKSGIVYFDSGMYEGNNRAYSQWRANNIYWDSLITEWY